MTMPSRPDRQPDRGLDDDGEIPMFLSQRVMTMISIVAVAGLILGSASVVFLFTDWGLNVAAIIGLVMAALLVLIWFRLPGRGAS